MELDKRIKDLSKIYNVFNRNSVTGNKQGYFANSLSEFSDLSNCVDGNLIAIDDDSGSPFISGVADGGCIIKGNFSFFTSIDNVQSEKKYRPYNTIEEFCDEGFEILVFREKDNPSMEYHVRYNGYKKCDNVYKVILGNISYFLNDLFTDYEYLDEDGNWKPFGVEE